MKSDSSQTYTRGNRRYAWRFGWRWVLTNHSLILDIGKEIDALDSKAGRS